MRVLISGAGRIAAVDRGSTVDLLRVGHETPIEIVKYEAERLFSTLNDTVEKSCNNLKEAWRLFKTETSRNDSLILFLGILNEEVTVESKIDLSRRLDVLLEHEDTKSYLGGVMYARPLPDDQELRSDFSALSESAITFDFIDRLVKNQNKIADYYKHFETIARDCGLDREDAGHVEGILVNAEVPYKYIQGKAVPSDLAQLKFKLIESLKELSFSNHVEFSRRLTEYISQYVVGGVPNATQLVLKESSGALGRPKIDARIRASGKLAFDQASAQIKRIEKALRTSHLDQAQRFAEQLVNDQVDKGDSLFAAQSLCQISEVAKKLELYDLQLAWAKQAIDLNTSDGRCFGHAADAHLNLGEIEKAKVYFEKSIEAGSSFKAYGLTGLARIERSLFNYDLALDYLDQAREYYPNDEVIANFRADLLRDLRRFEESKEEYKKSQIAYPASSIPWCGLASVYVDNREFKLAEETYTRTLELFLNPEDRVVALNGLAGLYSRLARFEEAHKLLDESISYKLRDDNVSVLSKARVFTQQGKLDNAEKLLRSRILDKPSIPALRIRLIQVYVYGMRLDLAEKEIKDLEKQFKASADICLTKAMFYRARANYSEALRMVDRAIELNPLNIRAFVERANIFKFAGDLSEAKSNFSKALQLNKYCYEALSGFRIVEQLEGGESSLPVVGELNREHDPVTFEDYHQIGLQGLMELHRGNTKQAKKLILVSYNAGFAELRTEFAAGLSMTRLLSKQFGSAVKSVNEPLKLVDHLQKALVFGEQAKIPNLKQCLSRIGELNLDPKSEKIRDLIVRRYDSYSEQANLPSAETIITQQVENILLAA